MRTKINHLICKSCEKSFTTFKRSDTKYCSNRCHLDKHNSSRKGRNAYYESNKERIRSKISERYEKIKNTDEFKEKQRLYAYQYQKQRCTTDLNYKLRKKLRSRLATAIDKRSKSGSAVRDLGCTIEEFAANLERRSFT